MIEKEWERMKKQTNRNAKNDRMIVVGMSFLEQHAKERQKKKVKKKFGDQIVEE